MPSQYDEDVYITRYFNDINDGIVLDVGAYDPILFSNSQKLIEKGWRAVLIEPSPECFQNIENYYKDNPNVIVINTAIGTVDGEIEFYNSEGAVATAKQFHYERWKDTQKDFRKITVPCMTWDTFYKTYPLDYNFINIDCEGMDYEILTQIPLKDMPFVKMICVEYNYNPQKILSYLENCGYTLFHYTAENYIVIRRRYR